jgi:hypothetical protein
MAKTREKRHAFRFKIVPGGKIMTVWAKVLIPRCDVDVPLKAEHVRESIKLKGVGNTQTCTMAVCARREAASFPHKVEGYIDWYYERAWVVSRLDQNGWPCECYVYAHNDNIGRLNDTPAGQRKLLAQLVAEGGERIIHLSVPPRSTGRSHSGRQGSRNDGSRTRRHLRGTKLRWAVAGMGVNPPML